MEEVAEPGKQTELAELEEWVALIDACIEPIATRPVDLNDPDWMRKLKEGPRPLDEAGIRPETEAALRDVLSRYEEGDEEVRAALRALLERCHCFASATTLPFEPTPQGFRQRLVEMSVEDQGRDTRDMMVGLNGLCEQARDSRPRHPAAPAGRGRTLQRRRQVRDGVHAGHPAPGCREEPSGLW